jgi:uncharacterized surface anchored protein
MNDARILIEEGIADPIRIRMRYKGYNRQTTTLAMTIDSKTTLRYIVYYYATVMETKGNDTYANTRRLSSNDKRREPSTRE